MLYTAAKNSRTPARGSIALVLGVLLFVSACTTSTGSRRVSPAQVEIQEAVGFTITEQSRISSNARTDYDQAVDYLARGEMERGIDILEALVESSPDLSAPRIDLGIAYHRRGNLEAAEQNLKAALESHPQHPIALNELGIVYRKTGQFALARRSYEAALTVYPGYHYARRNLAVLCDLYLGDLDCALENYTAYMKTVPGDEQAQMWIADLQYRLGRQEGS